ncbi:FAD-binding oxidoreductase [Lactobacillus mulieris]|uniref:FAD-binding protein n=1 Tax=Lactobacillus mulieris TaxID=2508708 RepID=A0AAW5X0F7_9LACO|nr:FAD-linked oxidase C-terminal domain-containing protein [Lactobacillus mulieris]MCZ3622865.1 FAD-binding protein [Lactobacillus mulieris]MCZ3624544.1 FAD-binding protein [Lactobacillus mulieris]MCZ3636869.1 FAD-binding protein [Lactobacillus mulieris]MCZ3690814.1 FAD-binding protein [Lactobacillus mulieris]MCZ3696772.1 FAD-binding protein [Lactobacillus mulieris]
MTLEFPAFTKEKILADLKNLINDGTVSTDLETLKKQSFSDKLAGQHGLALAFIDAQSIPDIQATLAVARKYHLPVITQNKFTSTVIGADASDNALILSTASLNKIIELNTDDGYAIVEPGVINGDLDTAAREKGYFYAPDPASRPFAGIGGNIATNAGGLSGVKYGSTRDNVLGLKVVLANGEVITVGGKTTKQAFGYDLTHLFVGSEGTLGIIVEATVKLLPLPLGKSAMGLAFFQDMTTLAKATSAIRRSGSDPVMLEAIDINTLKAIDKFKNSNYSANGNAALIFKIDGITDEKVELLKNTLSEFSATKVTLTSDESEQKQIIELRQAMLPAIFTGRNAVMEDMAVPVTKMAELVDYIQKLSKEYSLEIFTSGHAGEGNLHPTITWSTDLKETPEEVSLIIKSMFNKALELGGTISGEHAVGLLKNKWNNVELGESVDMLQHQIKNLFDPMGILNPKRKID